MFRVIAGIIAILAALFVLVITLISNIAEILLETGFAKYYIISALLFLISGILGVFLKKNKPCRIVSSLSLLAGSLFGLIIFTWLLISDAITSGITIEAFRSLPYGDVFVEFFLEDSVISIVTAIFSIILFVSAVKKPKQKAAPSLQD